MGLYGGPFVLRRSGCVHYSYSFQWSVRGLLRAGTTVLPMQAEHPSLFVQWVGEGAVGKDAADMSDRPRFLAALLPLSSEQCTSLGHQFSRPLISGVRRNRVMERTG
ncbi:hypothetical protein GOODEAATRI_018598 [Goodea atripinnis]|uniref:Uncharacterized protein n=1 Tax=Goodea atripinnis TaxID=208336 RepID=A0ABV0NE18_9TELE